ncbi:hypothetical protein E2320_019885, partial [Naja naja]
MARGTELEPVAHQAQMGKGRGAEGRHGPPEGSPEEAMLNQALFLIQQVTPGQAMDGTTSVGVAPALPKLAPVQVMPPQAAATAL